MLKDLWWHFTDWSYGRPARLLVIGAVIGIILGLLLAAPAWAGEHTHQVGDYIPLPSYCTETAARGFIEFWKAEENTDALWEMHLVEGNCFQSLGLYTVRIMESIGPLEYTDKEDFYIYVVGETVSDGTKYVVIYRHDKPGDPA